MQQTNPKNEIYNKKFAEDICDFFSGKRSGHIGIWRYSEPLFEGDKVNGMYHWAEYIRKAKEGNAYYVFDGEIDAIKKLSKKISEHIRKKNTSVIDLGPGSEDALLNKICPIMESLDSKHYTQNTM